MNVENLDEFVAELRRLIPDPFSRGAFMKSVVDADLAEMEDQMSRASKFIDETRDARDLYDKGVKQGHPSFQNDVRSEPRESRSKF